MLVLGRKKDHTIVIGKEEMDIKVTVIDIRGDNVRLGIEAPRDMFVHRKEVLEAIRRENEETAKTTLEDIVEDTRGNR
jgi:carbon storage regulator